MTSSLIAFALHALIPALEMLLRPHELLVVLNALVICVLVTCLVHGRAVVAVGGTTGLLVVWATSLGTILFWLMGLVVLQQLSLL